MNTQIVFGLTVLLAVALSWAMLHVSRMPRVLETVIMGGVDATIGFSLSTAMPETIHWLPAIALSALGVVGFIILNRYIYTDVLGCTLDASAQY